MFAPVQPSPRSPAEDLDYVLRRAQEEAVAQIRAMSSIAAERHAILAEAYRAQALALMGGTQKASGAN